MPGMRTGLPTACAALAIAAMAVNGIARAPTPAASAPPVSAPEAHAEAGRPVPAAPTFNEHVSRLVHANCAPCHRPAQAAPFPLLSYDDVRRRGRQIASVTTKRIMPPWHAGPGLAPFEGERRLTDAEIATIRAWVERGMPEGPGAAPAPPRFPAEWTLGTPDLVLTLPDTIDVPADGPDLFRNVVVPLRHPEDRWIRAVDFRASAPDVVHHVLYFVGPGDLTRIEPGDPLPGLGRLLRQPSTGRSGRDGAGAAGGWGALGGWVPGSTPRFLPAGLAHHLPRGTNLVLQMHLHPSGQARRERSTIALYFADGAPERRIVGIQVPPVFGLFSNIDIPAGARDYVVRDSFTLPVDVDAFAVRGHAHYLATEMTLSATMPDGGGGRLLWIPEWNFAWQDNYQFRDFVRLPRGTRLDAAIVYDNSEANPSNPASPPMRVRWGRQSEDEMGSLTLLVAAAKEEDAAALQDAVRAYGRQRFLRALLTGTLPDRARLRAPAGP